MREAEIQRDTKETSVHVRLNLDGNGNASIDTGVGFFNHMMELTAFHGSLDLDLHADGDLDVDDHHTIEDCGLALGTAFRNASGDRKGIQRYGSVTLPMDEALVNVSMDISGRPYLVFNASFDRDSIGMLSTEMIEEFFRAFAMNAGVSLHINLLYGKNDHHKAEAIFKAFGRCMKQAAEITGTALPSTKGYLE
ncbi:MAG: imidazoleglycerol-phosphate dehydratase HisB [Erysipelotrichaceae bacterium]|jgi:imidazoleglycerol phosphate dehydratase HisB|nr:imidazoleglycerol-phosphate dehydratase HisB [Erysipelotrichaceae bacterium]